MYQDEIFENALKEAREEKFQELKAEIGDMEQLIENLFTQLLECTAITSERDFNVCGI